MAQFSISYAGVADVESALHKLANNIGDVGDTLYTTANKIDGIASLANKGYVKKVHSQCSSAKRIAESISATNLDKIMSAYSNAEKQVLDNLAEVTWAESCFNGESVAIANKARLDHRDATIDDSIGRKIGDLARDTKDAIQSFRYWRSTKGSQLIEKLMKAGSGLPLVGGVINKYVRYVTGKAVGEVNGRIEEAEDIVQAVLNPTNPEALKKGGMAVVNRLGFGGFAQMANRYKKMTDAIIAKGAEIYKKDGLAKAAGYAVAASALATVQFVGDGAFNSGKYVFHKYIKAKTDPKPLRKNASKASQEKYSREKQSAKREQMVAGNGLSGVYGVVEDVATNAGDWCWSRLDNAFGL